ncbi:MAG: pyruvate dehydrogenase (acetyl-transferring) E1 component subunit alpha [Bacteroidetes bacterium]|nr:MAG: pyruvate dehydrogenase (acetyl-transferring) E1 component subunit alpha [Bacteroidota bacterium]
MAKTNSTVKEAKVYSKEQVQKWFEDMMLMRRFEERASQLYMQQKFRGFCHLYIGQEAVAAGLETAIRPDDQVITAYRDHGPALARGISANACMAELYGKATGCSKGKGGSMHFFSKEHNFLGGHGIVGGQIPLGAGVAFANKYRGQDNICVCMMGDGAVRQGVFHEALNMAMTWKLPVLYIIENNRYAMGTSVERTSNVTDLYKLGRSYDMPSKPIDGMDVIDVYEELLPIVEHVRSGKGPYLVEMKTYRYKGHSMSDPAKYRTREELNKYRGRDPLANIKLYMHEHQLFTDEEIKEMEKRIKDIVEESVKFAEESPFPDLSALYEDVYVGEYPFLMD